LVDGPDAYSGGADAGGGDSDAIVDGPDADGGDPDADGGEGWWWLPQRQDAGAGDALCSSAVRVGAWRPMSTVGAPHLLFPKAVWTGREMLVWSAVEPATGGPITVAQGARYDPALDRWTDMSVVGQPLPQQNHSAVWLDSTNEMMIWGGSTGGHGVGALYNPATDSWRSVSPVGAPLDRVAPALVATSVGAIVWCGRYGDPPASGDGALYDPVADRWRAITTEGAPPCTFEPPYAWTGQELVVFGGGSDTRVGGTFVSGTTTAGGLYDPMTDRWRPLGGRPPQDRWKTSAVFGGGAFIFIGGVFDTGSANSYLVTDGARYDVATSTWRVLPANAVTGPIYGYSGGAWISGGTLGCRGAAAFWGGQKPAPDGEGYDWRGDGLLYFPDADAWEPMQNTGAPAAREHNLVVSTGSTIIVWGGSAAADSLTTGAIYTP
jgi:hypothetical protein